jgi:hypothetical protein
MNKAFAVVLTSLLLIGCDTFNRIDATNPATVLVVTSLTGKFIERKSSRDAQKERAQGILTGLDELEKGLNLKVIALSNAKEELLDYASKEGLDRSDMLVVLSLANFIEQDIQRRIQENELTEVEVLTSVKAYARTVRNTATAYL